MRELIQQATGSGGAAWPPPPPKGRGGEGPPCPPLPRRGSGGQARSPQGSPGGGERLKSVNLQERTRAWLDIRPGEGRSTSLMLLHSFFTGTSRVFFETAASALFLAHYDAAFLPYFYLLVVVPT